MTISVREELNEWLVGLFDGTIPDRKQFEQLTMQHAIEVDVDRDVHKLDINWTGYAAMARARHLSMIVVRDGGKMVGYFLQMVTSNPHYQRIKQATEDSHFILPEYRGQGYGKEMQACAEQAAIARGASVMKIRTKSHRDDSGFWESRGFKRTEYVYQKVLRS